MSYIFSMHCYVPYHDMYKFDIQSLIPFEPIARLNLHTRNPSQKDINAVCGSVMYVAHKYERLEDEYKKVHSEKKALHAQIRALTKQTAPRPQSGMLQTERLINVLTAAEKRNAQLQKALAKLQLEHDDKASRLARAEAKIRELENAKGEKVQRDFEQDMVVAPDGFSYKKMSLKRR